MAVTSNGMGVAHAHGLIAAGDYDDTASWSFTADDGNALLGPKGDDWANYAQFHLGVDGGAANDTKARWDYPYGKGGKVYGAALRAIRSRAAQQNETAIYDAAGHCLDLIKAASGKAMGPKVGRAYSALTIKAFDDEKREFSGIASTPSVDRMGDVVDPMGAVFTLPMPLLLDHNARQAVGHVTFAKPNAAGIPFTAVIASVDEPGTIKDMVDGAWQLVKARLRSFVSIGFSALKYEIMKDGGYQFNSWEWLELSLVTIPANQDAVINDGKSFDAAFRAVKSIDAALLAASGKQQRNGIETTAPAGVSATKQIPVVKAQEAKPQMPKNIAEQISAFETTRAAKGARMSEIMDTAGEKGETLDAAATEEYDTLEAELKAIDEHLARLKRHEQTNVARAVDVSAASDAAAASRVRAGLTVPAAVRAASFIPKGMGFTRFCMAVARSKGNLMQAERMVSHNERWMAETPDVIEVIRSAVAAGTTTDSAWAGPLVQYQNLVSEFIEYLRPLTIIGRIPGIRYVPFKVKIPRQTGKSTAGWVGEGQAKPVSALAFDSVTMDIATISDIVIFSQQLAQLSQPSVELLIRDDLAKSIVNFMDAQFVDPTVAANGTTSPASITNGLTPTISSGITGDALRTDVGALVELFLEANMQLNSACWVMSQVTAARINLIRNALGQKEYPEINANGGVFEGFPVITSQSVPATGGSPTDGYPMILMNAGDILIADDGQVRIDASSEASLQMDTSPDSPTTGSTTLVSLWQQGYMGLKADRDINWVKRRSTAVAYISNAKYTTG